jgi:membrane protease YdiL (CAAX protease family)
MNTIQNLLKSRPFLIVEFLLLCLTLPTIIITAKLAPYMFGFLWSAALYAFVIMIFVERQSLKTLWRWEAVKWEALKPILIRFALATAGMIAFCLWIAPDRFMMLPKTRPEFVLILCCVYPILSALPQELVFCSFFFKRYGRFFGAGLGMVIASALLFAYAHVLYINWVAPTLSLIAGLIFADTYRKSQSLALVTIEHGLYGNALFIIGLGWYFYGGAVVSGG